MGYLKDTVRGVSWMGGLRAGTRLVTFFKILILARILTPNEFGLFGIAMLALAFLEIVTETGINIFLIQEKAELEKYNDTAWVVSIGRGFLMSLILFFAAPFIAAFFNSPSAQSLLYLTAALPLIRGFINPAIVRFQKELQFNKEFFLRSTLFTIDALVAVALGILTKSASSFVWGMLVAATLEVFYSFLYIRPRPRLVYLPKRARKVISRGKWVTLAGFFNYLFENVDDAVVGRLVSTASLGIYQVAYKISSLPITEIADVVIKVTFPVYTKISKDAGRLKAAFIKTFLAISALVVPAGLLLYFFTEAIVALLLGSGWSEVVPIVKLLAFFGIARGLTTATHPLFLSLKKQNYVTAITLAGILGLGIFVLPLVNRFGVLGAAYAAVIGSLFSLPVAAYFTFRTFGEMR